MAKRTEADEESIKKHDENSYYAIEKYLDEYGLEFHNQEMEDIVEQCRATIKYFKKIFDLKRPFDHDNEIKPKSSTTNKTPSYPSGHSTQGIFISKVFGKMYPTHEKQFNRLGKMISNSRLMARAHFPSDTKCGEKVGNLIFNNIKGKLK